MKLSYSSNSLPRAVLSNRPRDLLLACFSEMEDSFYAPECRPPVQIRRHMLSCVIHDYASHLGNAWTLAHGMTLFDFVEELHEMLVVLQIGSDGRSPLFKVRATVHLHHIQNASYRDRRIEPHCSYRTYPMSRFPASLGLRRASRFLERLPLSQCCFCRH